MNDPVTDALLGALMASLATIMFLLPATQLSDVHVAAGQLVLAGINFMLTYKIGLEGVFRREPRR